MYMPTNNVLMPSQTTTTYFTHIWSPKPYTNTNSTLPHTHNPTHWIHIVPQQTPRPTPHNIQNNEWKVNPLITIIVVVKRAIHEHSINKLTTPIPKLTIITPYSPERHQLSHIFGPKQTSTHPPPHHPTTTTPTNKLERYVLLLSRLLGGITPSVASWITVINIKLMGSHSCRYVAMGVSSSSSSFLVGFI